MAVKNIRLLLRFPEWTAPPKFASVKPPNFISELFQNSHLKWVRALVYLYAFFMNFNWADMSIFFLNFNLKNNSFVWSAAPTRWFRFVLSSSKINISSTMRNHVTCHLPLERAWRGLSSYEGLTCIDKVLHSYFLQFVKDIMKWLEFFLMASSRTFMASRATTPTKGFNNASRSSSSLWAWVQESHTHFKSSIICQELHYVN